MTSVIFKAQGSFPFYFKNPEEYRDILSHMGLPLGFRCEHANGLILYIHRCKNKREIAPFGLTIPLLVRDIDQFKSQMKSQPVYFSETKWFNQNAYLMTFEDGKKFLIVQENQLLPSNYQIPQNNKVCELYGKGYMILACKDPKRSAEWYQQLLDCSATFYSDDLTFNILTNQNENQPGLIIFHQKETDKSKIGPRDYQNFCLTAPNIYSAWSYLKQKNKINPTWRSPREDGFYRTIQVACPDGYNFKIYGEVPYVNLAKAANLTKKSINELKEAIKAQNLKILDSKILQKLKLTEEFYICEDHLLAYHYNESPYEKHLTFG